MIKNKRIFIQILSAVIVGSSIIFSIGGMRAYADIKGSFSVLSLNVAGLPEGLSSSDPKENTLQMSPLLNDYDLVSVQEDFAYHDDLIKYDNHKFKTESSGNVPIGDGMNFMSHFSLQDIGRYTWNKRYGFISNGADAMTPKGILYSSMEIAPGYYIDIYDIHADAGDDEGSYEARRDNMNQLANMIKERSQGKAVIVIGDTNSRYTRSEDNFEEAIVKTCGLKDPWIQIIRNGNVPQNGDALIDKQNPNSGDNEVVDKIFYRSGENIDLSVEDYNLLADKFIDSKGNQLSDHYPITADFSYNLKDNIKMSETYGGDGGYGFSFIEEAKDTLPSQVSIKCGNRVDNISFKYNDKSISAGGNGGTLKTLDLNENEYIKSIEVSKAKKGNSGTYRISYIKITTNLGNILEGGTKGITIKLEAPQGYAVSGLYGKAENEVDKIGTIYTKLS